MPVSFRVPHDLRYIAKALFAPTECDLWEIHWKKLLKPLLRKYDLAEVVGEGDEAMEALAGEGEFSSPEDQILLAQELLQDIAGAGKEALLKIPDGKIPLQNFSSIMQGPEETFITFVDRLKEAIERQIDNAEARAALLRKMAISNSNSETKKILRALPQDPEPTISQMVEACTKAMSMEHTVALAVSKGVGEAMINLQNTRCFNCGQLGHIQVNCPHWPQIQQPILPPQDHILGTHFIKITSFIYSDKGTSQRETGGEARGRAARRHQVALLSIPASRPSGRTSGRAAKSSSSAQPRGRTPPLPPDRYPKSGQSSGPPQQRHHLSPG
ncbi:endogenous retrovirus group K member 6 Gag polyprotein-like [Vidua chalybeata]|uniref:endogenous retrovirus group K member 6 Gag polyprotein-like n=1 Tax=Vidua chalybeata TaxID=81927 RepID=UPI0023A7FA03|nr:endogenous retrovirus group K member 6 Gag polyprotein-like [Vidua chalybeata]